MSSSGISWNSKLVSVVPVIGSGGSELCHRGERFWLEAPKFF